MQRPPGEALVAERGEPHGGVAPNAGESVARGVELEAIVREAPAHNIYGTGRTTEAMRERQAKNRARGAVQREAVYLHRAVHDEAVAEGASYREAWNRADVAEIDFLDSSGLFPAYVERLRQHVRYLYGQGNQQGRSHD